MATIWQQPRYRVPTNWKRVWSLIGGAAIALLTLLAVAWGMIRADAQNHPLPEPPATADPPAELRAAEP